MENKPQDRFVELPNGIFVNLDNIVHITPLYEKNSKSVNMNKSCFGKPIWQKCYSKIAFDIIYKDCKKPFYIWDEIDYENVKDFDPKDFAIEYKKAIDSLEAGKKLITDKLNLI